MCPAEIMCVKSREGEQGAETRVNECCPSGDRHAENHEHCARRVI